MANEKSIPEAANETTEPKVAANENSAENSFSLDKVLQSIDKIINDKEYINSAISELRQMDITGSGDIGSAGKAKAIGKIVKEREITNRQTLKILEKMYDDLKPQKPDDETAKLMHITDAISKYPPEFAADIIKKVVQQMFVKAGAEIVK